MPRSHWRLGDAQEWLGCGDSPKRLVGTAAQGCDAQIGELVDK
jgi:hypothetical protein